MNGIINVYKEKGYTSHDVVAKLRGILHMRKIGHTGTLDPDATGVLPVCVGKATKVCDLLTNKDKTYRALVQLGVTTDTLDMSGTVLSESEVHVTKEDVLRVMERFVGEIQQIPPMYSAIKVNGKRLYELAREGREIERKPRKITIYRIEMVEEDFENHLFTLEIECSKGTYIRSLCHDIGQALGCGAAMKELVRTKVGNFAIGDAMTLAEIEKHRSEDILLPIDRVFDMYGACVVAKEGLRFLQNGNSVRASQCHYETMPEDKETVRMYDEAGEFYALYRYEKRDNQYHVVKMFHE